MGRPKKIIKEVKPAFTQKELTEEQKEYVLENWDREGINLLLLTQETFDNFNLDGRSNQGKLVKEFLGDRQVKTAKFDKIEPFILSESDKLYITNNIGAQTIHEIAKTLYNNPKIAPLGREVRAISKYVENYLPDADRYSNDKIPEGRYFPPAQMSGVTGKINKYLKAGWDHRDLTTPQKNRVIATKSYMHSPRYLETINSYVSLDNRELFEAEFVRTVHDKPDLTPDEVNICVNLCQSYVLMKTVLRHLDMLNLKFEDEIGNEDSKVSMSLAEMIKVKTDELNKCDKRQAELIGLLSVSRKDRQKNQISDSASMAKLIEWWRNEEERVRGLKLAKLQEEADKNEIDRLEDFSDVFAKVMGIGKSELLYG